MLGNYLLYHKNDFQNAKKREDFCNIQYQYFGKSQVIVDQKVTKMFRKNHDFYKFSSGQKSVNG